MKLLYHLAPLLLAFLLVGCAQNPARNNPAGPEGAFAPAGAGFSVDMPCKKVRAHVLNNTHLFDCEMGDRAYVASYLDLNLKRHLTAAEIKHVLDGVDKPNPATATSCSPRKPSPLTATPRATCACG